MKTLHVTPTCSLKLKVSYRTRFFCVFFLNVASHNRPDSMKGNSMSFFFFCEKENLDRADWDVGSVLLLMHKTWMAYSWQNSLLIKNNHLNKKKNEMKNRKWCDGGGGARPRDVFIFARSVARCRLLPRRRPVAARRPPGSPPGTAWNQDAKTRISVTANHVKNHFNK